MLNNMFYMRASLFLLRLIVMLSLALPTQADVLKIAPEQQYMLKAAQYVMARQFKEAEDVYSQVIAYNNRYIDAYLQRAVIRRELGDTAASNSDAGIVVRLADAQISTQPKNARLYYQRAMGYRVLKRFSSARQDFNTAISLSNTAAWRADLQAMALEEKMAQ